MENVFAHEFHSQTTPSHREGRTVIMRRLAISIMSDPGGMVVVKIDDGTSDGRAAFFTGKTRPLAISVAASSPHVSDDVKAVLVSLAGGACQ
jgi:hypothetical protein